MAGRGRILTSAAGVLRSRTLQVDRHREGDEHVRLAVGDSCGRVRMNVASFSTADIRPKDRIEVWTEQIWSAIGRLYARAAPDSDFTGAVQFGDTGVIQLCNITVGPHRIERTPELIRRDDRGVLKVVFQLQGHSFVEQSGRALALSPGEWGIYDASRPYRVSNADPVELLAMLVPRDRLTTPSLDITRYALTRFSSNAGLGRLALRFMRSLLEDMASFGPHAGPSLTDAAIELVRMAVLEHMRASSALSSGDLLKERIKTYIHRHLRDPRFSIEMIANAMNCSKRHLHKTFREDHETLSQYLWNCRLDHCRAELLDPESVHKSITEIAFSWGFNNAAHFSRSFKARFGVTPSWYRLSNGAPPASPGSRPLEPAYDSGALELGLKVARTA
jgi:AraC-like DNA-binding protein